MAVLAAVAGGFVALAHDRSRCASQAELQRPRGAEEVVAAFAGDRITLHRTVVPSTVVGDARPYHGATAYRYVTRRAALYVVICRTRCVEPPVDLGETPVIVVPDRPPQQLRQFASLGNNIATYATDDDRRSARRLVSRAQPALNALDAAVPVDSHCYIG
jgi:hypothetical protein